MFYMIQPTKLLFWGVSIIVIFGLLGACSPVEYKQGADEEVYRIIDSKWQDRFGQKVNYTISDVPPSPNDIDVDKGVPTSKIINLAEAVAIATAHNREYQRQKEQLYLSALDLTLVRHQFARRWFGTIDASYASDGGDETVGGGAELGFNQLLASGAQIGMSISMDLLHFITGDPGTSLWSVLNANITQPLLRGAGRMVVQENLTQAERDVLYQIRSFNRYRKMFVVSLISAYYRVLQRRDEVTNAENNYNSRIESRKRLEMEAEAGRKPRFEVDQARQSELSARDSFVRAKQRYEQQLDEFKILLSLPTDAQIELDQNELKALEKIGVIDLDYTLDMAVEMALVQRLDFANSQDVVEDAARKVIVAANGLEADLNLVGSFGASSSKGSGSIASQSGQVDYSLGLQADLPLDRKAERNTYRRALITLQQQRREYENDRDQVKLDVRAAYRQLREAAERYQTQTNSLELAQIRVESTTLLLQAGRVTTRDLLDSQDALLQAQNNITAALVDHAIAKLSFFRDIGVLQVRPDGMWGQGVQ